MGEKVTCICCPMGCSILVEKDGKDFHIIGNECKKGEEYALQEVINPQRILTSTVRIKNGIQKMLPVRSEKTVPKNIVVNCVKELAKVELAAPIKRGDVVLKNILNTGVTIIASRDMDVL